MDNLNLNRVLGVPVNEPIPAERFREGQRSPFPQVRRMTAIATGVRARKAKPK